MVAENGLQQTKQNIDDDFFVFNGILLTLIHVGLVCMEASRARLKYALDIFFKIFLHLFISSTVYWLYGYGLAFNNGNLFMGLNWWNNIFNNQSTMTSNWLYNYLTAALPVTILSGTVAEFCNPLAFVVNSIIITGAVQPIAVHWIWADEGWLKKLGYSDSAGASVIFAFAGGASFGASLITPRRNRDMATIYSAPLFGIGAAVTIIGFLVLNCGALHRLPSNADGEKLLSQVVHNTIISGSGGCIVSLVIGKILQVKRRKRLEIVAITVNGSLAGMVAVCGGVNNYTTLEAFIIGILGALIFALFHYLFYYLKVDDPADAFPVYFGAGLWGTLATHIFTTNGLLRIDDANTCLRNLLISFIGISAITAWSTIWTMLIFLILKLCRALKKDGRCELKELGQRRNPLQEEECYIEALPYLISEKSAHDGGEHRSTKRQTLRANLQPPNIYENMGSQAERELR